MGRRRFSICTLALVAVALLALPASAPAHFGFVGGFSQMGGATGGKWNLTAGTTAGPEETFGGESSIVDIAITPDGMRAYGVKIGGELIPFDVASGTAGTPILLGGEARAIAITPDGTRAYTANTFSNSVSVIDLASETETGTIAVGSFPSAIAITPDGTRAYVTNSGSDDVSVIALASGAVIGGTIPVGGSPNGIAITPDGARAYVTNRIGNSVSVIDVISGAVVATIPLGAEPIAISITPDGRRAYVPTRFGSASDVIPVDLVTNTAGTPIPLSGFLEDIAITPDGSRAYIPGGSPDQVTPIDLDANTALSGFGVPFNPDSVAVVPNQPPHASFTTTPASATPGQTVSFSANTSDSDTGTAVARYDWDFGDGTTEANAGRTPSHAYAKPGTYRVTVTETDNEGCSVSFVFTGQTAYCNGSSIARTSRTVVVTGTNICPSVKAKASTFVPKRRPGKVLPGVRVRLSTGVPSRLTVTATLLYELDGKPASAGLGTIKVNVNKWRRVRFALPPELRPMVPVGTPVKVGVRIESVPRDGAPCEAAVTNRNLKVHVVKVFPNRVQELRYFR